MSKTIQIRGVPDDVHATLRVRAAQAGLSLSDYLLQQIEGIARRPAIAEVLLRADRRPRPLDLDAETVLDEVRRARESA